MLAGQQGLLDQLVVGRRGRYYIYGIDLGEQGFVAVESFGTRLLCYRGRLLGVWIIKTDELEVGLRQPYALEMNFAQVTNTQ